MNLLIITICTLLASILSQHYISLHPIVAYTITFISASVFFLALAYQIFQWELSNNALFIIILASLAVRASFITTMPVGSDDIYRYLWDGKVQSNSINPYAYAPVSAELQHLASKDIPLLVNQPAMKTIYFPLSEWIFYFSYRMSGEQVWGIKVLLLAAEIFTLYGLFLLTTLINIPRRFILLYALCPLVFYEYAIDAHVDGFGLPLLIFSLYHYLGKKKLLSLLLLGFSLSIKPTGLVLLPIFFFFEKDWKERLKILLIPLITLALQFVPYLFTANPFESLTTFTKNWTFNGFVFNLLDSMIHDNQKSRLICAVLLGAAILLLAFSKKQLTGKIYYAILLLLLFSPIVHPWYAGWLAVTLPFSRRWSGLVFVSTISLTSFTYITFQLQGVWKEEPIFWIIEYLPVVVFMMLELRNDHSAASVVYSGSS